MVRAQHISLASVSLRLLLTVTVRGRGETEQPCQPFTPGHAAHGLSQSGRGCPRLTNGRARWWRRRSAGAGAPRHSPRRCAPPRVPPN